MIVDTGERTTGLGRIGTDSALAPDTGRAPVATLAPDGIVAEAIDVYDDVLARAGAHRAPSGSGGWRPERPRSISPGMRSWLRRRRRERERQRLA